MIISQVVASPTDVSLPLVKEYQAALTAADPAAKPGYISLEGYVTGRVMAHGLSQAGADPTRVGLVQALAGSTAIDLGGMTLRWDASIRQLSHHVWLTQIRAGVPVQVATVAAR